MSLGVVSECGIVGRHARVCNEGRHETISTMLVDDGCHACKSDTHCKDYAKAGEQHRAAVAGII